MAGKTTHMGSYYASLLCPRIVLRHHAGCSEYRCLALQVDERDYLQRISANLGWRTFQVVRFADGSLRVIDSNVVSEYVAMSHIWAEGPGNNPAKELPSWQIRTMQTSVFESRLIKT